MWALSHVQGYQKRIAKAFNKKVKSRNLKVGDLVLKELRGEISDPRGKMKPRWSEPFFIMEIVSNGSVKITDLDREEMFQPINRDRPQKYNSWKVRKKSARLKTQKGSLDKT